MFCETWASYQVTMVTISVSTMEAQFKSELKKTSIVFVKQTENSRRSFRSMCLIINQDFVAHKFYYSLTASCIMHEWFYHVHLSCSHSID